MHNITRIAAIMIIVFSMFQVQAQNPQVPSGTPGKMPLTTPKDLKLPIQLPDLKIIRIDLRGIYENRTTHQFDVEMRITFKNEGTALVANNCYLNLQSLYGTTAGGTDYSLIGVPAQMLSIRPGGTVTQKFTFSKDITAMGRARLQCFVTLDCTNVIQESNEENNRSDYFYISPPR